MARPFIYIGSAMFISLFIFSYFGIYSAVAVFGIAAILFLILLFVKKKNTAVKAILLCSAVLILSASVFIPKMLEVYRIQSAFCDSDPHTVSGTLEKYEADYGRHYYTLKNVTVDNQKIETKLLVNSSVFRFADVDDYLTLTNAVIYKPGSDEKGKVNYYMTNGVYIGVYSSGDFSVETSRKHSVFYYLDTARKYISGSLNKNMDSTYAAVSNALLTGDKSEIDYDTELNFRYSGVSHLFAVSGFHLTLWTSMIGAAFSSVRSKKKHIGNVLILVFIIFFMALTGFSKSVVRAGIMLIITVLGRFAKYRADPLNSLFIAVSLILTANPFAAVSISLQMSFLATFGIITLSEPVTQPVFRLKRKIKYKSLGNAVFGIYSVTAVSVIGTLFTIPVSVYSFEYFSAASPLTNLLCLFPAQALIALSGFGVLLSPFKSLSKLIFLICIYLSKYILFVTDKIAHMRFAVVDCYDSFTIIPLAIVFAAFFILLMIFWNKNTALRRTVAAAVAAITAISFISSMFHYKNVKIAIADVGNGTSIVYQNGNTNMMIGCGGSKYGEYNLTRICDGINTRNFRLILIPDSTYMQSYYAYDVLKRYSCDKAVVTNEIMPDYIKSVFPDGTIRTDNYSCHLDENTDLVYINNEKLSGARITTGGFACTVFFRPVADADSIPADWLSGDLLITRKNLPDIDVQRFKNIVISTDSDIIYDSENIYSTKTSGKITYTFSDSGYTSVKEEKHDHK